MAETLRLPLYSEEQALSLIIGYLKGTRTFWGSEYVLKSDLCIPNLIAEVLEPQAREVSATGGEYSHDFETNTAPFYNVAWDLCTRGILRPAAIPPQHIQYLTIGSDYFLTPYGKDWLTQTSDYEVLPSSYGRFGELLASHSERFGSAYHARSQEAVSCYRAHTYLACCVMCGAASESILLALAVAKKGSEEEALALYKGAKGRQRLEDFLMAHANSHIRSEFPNFLGLLKYWRDESGHGAETTIGESEAFTSMLLLLRFAQFANERWDELTRNRSQ